MSLIFGVPGDLQNSNGWVALYLRREQAEDAQSFGLASPLMYSESVEWTNDSTAQQADLPDTERVVWSFQLHLDNTETGF